MTYINNRYESFILRFFKAYNSRLYGDWIGKKERTLSTWPYWEIIAITCNHRPEMIGSSTVVVGEEGGRLEIKLLLPNDFVVEFGLNVSTTTF